MTLAWRRRASGLERWAGWEVKGGGVAGEGGHLVGQEQWGRVGEGGRGERGGGRCVEGQEGRTWWEAVGGGSRWEKKWGKNGGCGKKVKKSEDR